MAPILQAEPYASPRRTLRLQTTEFDIAPRLQLLQPPHINRLLVALSIQLLQCLRCHHPVMVLLMAISTARTSTAIPQANLVRVRISTQLHHILQHTPTTLVAPTSIQLLVLHQSQLAAPVILPTMAIPHTNTPLLHHTGDTPTQASSSKVHPQSTTIQLSTLKLKQPMV